MTPVTEEEWLSIDHLRPMLDMLKEQVTPRKLRLFAVASCRRIWNLLTDERSRAAVQIAEDAAEGKADMESMESSSAEAWQAVVNADGEAAYFACHPDAWTAAVETAVAASGEELIIGISRNEPNSPDWHRERIEEAQLLRHITGNPFKPYPEPP